MADTVNKGHTGRETGRHTYKDRKTDRQIGKRLISVEDRNG